jgi:hypothetical protein
MSALTETQFTVFDRPFLLDNYQAPRHKRRAHLRDLVRDIGELENDNLIDLIRVAIGEARRRGIGPASAESDSSRTVPPVMEQKSSAVAWIVCDTAPLPDMPPARASMVRAAVRAGFSPVRVAKDFSVSTATIRKLMVPCTGSYP